MLSTEYDPKPLKRGFGSQLNNLLSNNALNLLLNSTVFPLSGG